MAEKGKSKKYKTKYNPEWSKDYPISIANNNLYAFYCIPCKKNVSGEFQGKKDVERHCDPSNKQSNHNKVVAALKSNQMITSFSPSTSSSNETLRAEVLHTNMIVHHNLPFLLADHLAKNNAAMFQILKLQRSLHAAAQKQHVS